MKCVLVSVDGQKRRKVFPKWILMRGISLPCSLHRGHYAPSIIELSSISDGALALMSESLEHLCFDFYVYTGWEIEAHESIDRPVRWFTDVDEPLVDAHLVLFTRVLIDEGRAVDGVLALFCRKRDWTQDLCSRALGCLDDSLGRLVDDLVVVSSDLNADLELFFPFWFF